MPEPFGPLVFTAAQRRELKRSADLYDEQIEMLQRHLSLCRSTLTKPPPLNRVRHEIDSLARTLRGAQKAAGRFQYGSSVASEEALKRLELAEIELCLDTVQEPTTDVLMRVIGATSLALAVLKRARDGLSNEERRDRKSSPFPVQQIDKALLHGFIAHHNGGSLMADSDRGPLPPYRIKVSRTKEPFPTIARIFYEALGFADKDIDRPIRNYLAFERRRRAYRRALHPPG